jgi:hypothetical protein
VTDRSGDIGYTFGPKGLSRGCRVFSTQPNTFFGFTGTLIIDLGQVSEIAIRRATMDYHERDATFLFCCPAFHRLCAAVFHCAVS